MASSSESGKKMIATDMGNLTSDFHNLFGEVSDLKEELGKKTIVSKYHIFPFRLIKLHIVLHILVYKFMYACFFFFF